MASTAANLFKLNLKPGIHRESTSYSEDGSWYDCDRVRFREGKPENFRGYEKHLNSTFDGVSRDLITWQSNNTEKLLSFGTEQKLYVLTNDIIYDITPIVSTVTVGTDGTVGSLATSVGSNKIEVSLNSHGVSVNDYIFFTSASINNFATTDFAASSFGGPVYRAVSTSGLNHFYISTTSAATGTNTNAGTATLNFLLPTGNLNNIQGLGYGAGVYNAGASITGERAWNSPASSSNITFLATQWSLDNYGEDMLAVRRGSQLFHWNADASTSPERATIVATAPTSINSIVVSPNDRHVIAFGTNEFASGTFNPLLIRWSDQEDYTNWTPSVSSTSGEIQVVDGTTLKGGVRTRNAIHVWTDKAMYALQYVGPPFIFSLAQLGSNCGLISPHAAVNVDGISFWMSENNFYIFDGRVKKLDCTVRRYLYDDFNMTQSDKVYAAVNSEFHEVIWFYPKEGAQEPDAYVIYNYEEDTWAYGTSFYTTFKDATVFTNTIALGQVSAAADQYIWDNEPTSVFTGDGQALTSFLQSADFDVEDGNNLMFMDKIIPDYTINQGSIQFSVNLKEYPASNYSEKGPFEINAVTQKVDFRARGRQANVRVSCDSFNTSWKWGSVRLAVQSDGKR